MPIKNPWPLGKWLRQLAEKRGLKSIPLDSEASALWQLMDEFGPGPFPPTLTCGEDLYGKKAAELVGVTVREALNHQLGKWGLRCPWIAPRSQNKVLKCTSSSAMTFPLKGHSHCDPSAEGFGARSFRTKTGTNQNAFGAKDMRF